MPSPLFIILALIALVASAAGFYAKIHHDGYEQGVAETNVHWHAAAQAVRQREQAKIKTAEANLEAARAKRKVVYRTITQQVDKIVIRYRDRECLDPVGLCVANAAIGGKNADSCKPDEPVRPPTITGRWHGRLDLKMDRGSIGPLSSVR